VYGVPHSAYANNDAYTGTYSGAPSNEWAWVVQWQVVDGTTTNAIMGIVVQLEYDIEFFRPQTGGVPDTLTTKGADTSKADKDEMIRLLEEKIRILALKA